MNRSGSILTDDVRRLRAGMTSEEIVATVGKPKAMVSVQKGSPPSAVFRELGSQFAFPDVEADVVWTYQHATRPRL
jgi:hypothetical protein